MGPSPPPQRGKPGSSADGFTLVELLVVIVITAVLFGLLLPTLGRARQTARKVICGSNARQMALATMMYTEDHRGYLFPELEVLPGEGKRWWFGFESFDTPTAEGQRVLDRTRGRLWPYYRDTDSIEVCPSFPGQSPHYKPKFTTNWTTYGPPQRLIEPAQPAHLGQVDQPSRTLAFADTAQINMFQPPATPANPMFEQWHYVKANTNSVLYVHHLRATAAMLDGHVRLLEPQFGVSDLFREAPIGKPPTDITLQVD